MINRSCGGSAKLRNLGGKKQCFEGVTNTVAFGMNGQSFEKEEDLNDSAIVNAQIQSKKYVPFADIGASELSNTEDTFVDRMNGKFKTSSGNTGLKLTFDLSMCTYNALKSYTDQITHIYQVTDKDKVLCDVQEDGTITGRKVKSATIGKRKEAISGELPSVEVDIQFENDEFDILAPTLDFASMEGVNDVVISQESASATEIKVTVATACSNSKIYSFEDGDIVVKDASGAAQSVTFAVADSEGVYTLTGTGFANGFTVELNGVVLQGGKFYEEMEPLTLVVS